jgi:hypothetical protein
MEARYNFRKPKGERDDAQLHQELKAQNLPVLMVLSGEANPDDILVVFDRDLTTTEQGLSNSIVQGHMRKKRIRRSTHKVTQNVTLTVDDRLVSVDASDQPVNIILPDATQWEDDMDVLRIRRTDGGSKTVTVTAPPGCTVEKQQSLNLRNLGVSIRLIPNGTDWELW